MAKFILHGDNELNGHIRSNGNKNAALPIIAACLLTDNKITLHNIPNIGDIRSLLEIISDLGVTCNFLNKNSVEIQACKIKTHKPSPALSVRIRASILLVAPLLIRCGKVELPPPGGDVIGRRRIDTHMLIFNEMGATIEYDNIYRISASSLKASHIYLDEPSVTATENGIIAAVKIPGITIIENAACEPHVQDVCNFLNAMGAKITGIGTNRLLIEGVDTLSSIEYTIAPDHIEIGSFLGLAICTRSKLSIGPVIPKDMRNTLFGLKTLGIKTTIEGSTLHIPKDQSLEIQNDWNDKIPTLGDGPWPAFPADMMSIAIVIATQVRGTILFFEKMFESRLFFVDRLIDMGAKMVLCDPHRVVITGPSKLHGQDVVSPDIRAGMALLIASLCAKGQSTIHNIHQIDRGYDEIDTQLRAIGADIVRED